MIEVVNVTLGPKEKGEVRNPASGEGDMGNSMTDFFFHRLRASTEIDEHAKEFLLGRKLGHS